MNTQRHKTRKRLRGSKPRKTYAGPQPVPLMEGLRSTRSNFVEKTFMVRGFPRKHRRIETLRKNLQWGYAQFLIRKQLPSTAAELRSCYETAEVVTSGLNYSQLKAFQYA